MSIVIQMVQSLLTSVVCVSVHNYFIHQNLCPHTEKQSAKQTFFI